MFKKICSVEGCGTKTRALGFCRTHATRFYRHGDPHTVKDRNKNREPVFLGDLAYIPLSDAEYPEYTVIDRIDWPLVQDYTWSKHTSPSSVTHYARGLVRGTRNNVDDSVGTTSTKTAWTTVEVTCGQPHSPSSALTRVSGPRTAADSKV